MCMGSTSRHHVRGIKRRWLIPNEDTEEDGNKGGGSTGVEHWRVSRTSSSGWKGSMEATGSEKGKYAQKAGKLWPVPGLVSSSMFNVVGSKRCGCIPGKVVSWPGSDFGDHGKPFYREWCLFKTGLAWSDLHFRKKTLAPSLCPVIISWRMASLTSLLKFIASILYSWHVIPLKTESTKSDQWVSETILRFNQRMRLEKAAYSGHQA